MIFKKKHKLQWDTRFNNGPFTKHEKKQMIFRELRKRLNVFQSSEMIIWVLLRFELIA